MYVTRDLVDELGALRAQMKLLKAREGALRRQLLSDAHASVLEGDRFRASIRRVTARRFDARLLPGSMRGDPQFLRQVVSTVVRTETIAAEADATSPAAHEGIAIDPDLRSGGRRICDSLRQRGQHHSDRPARLPDLDLFEDEDFSVIEPF